jgi:hypothetical protein
MSDLNDQPEYEEHPLTEYLDFTFSSFGNPLIEQKNAQIILPVREFKVYSGFPGYDKDVIVLEGNIIFEQVVNSVRSIREIDDEATADLGRTQYKDLYRLDDGPFPKVSGNPFSFYIGGPTYDPPGWVEWDIDIVEIKVEAQKTKPISS